MDQTLDLIFFQKREVGPKKNQFIEISPNRRITYERDRVFQLFQLFSYCKIEGGPEKDCCLRKRMS